MCWHVLNFFNVYMVERFNMKELCSDSQWFGVPFGKQEVADLAARNELRAKQAIRDLGTRYLCHPVHTVTRVKTQFMSTAEIR